MLDPSCHLSRVIGHRGIPSHAPENTLAGFKMAKAQGLTWVEFDVMLSGSGTPIVFHDTTLDRTTNGRGKVASTDDEVMAKLDAGQWYDNQFTGERVPRFSEVIACLGVLGLHANVEIKPTARRAKATALATMEMIMEKWPRHFAPPLVSSFSIDALRVVHQSFPKTCLGLLLNHWKRNWQALADELNCVAVHVNYRRLNEKRVQAIKATGRHVLAYTVNSLSTAQRLWAWGVDAVFSDNPTLLMPT